MHEEILSELPLWGKCFQRQDSLQEALVWHRNGMQRDAVELDCMHPHERNGHHHWSLLRAGVRGK